MREVFGSSSEIQFLPRPADDPNVRCPDISRARELLGWEPPVGLREGLEAAAAWFQSGTWRVSWDDLANWWVGEVRVDPAYEADVTPLAMQLLSPVPGERPLDVGCGDGRLMAEMGARGALSFGVEASWEPLGFAVPSGPVVRAVLPSLGCLTGDSFDAALVSLVLQHLEDEETEAKGFAKLR